MSQLRLLVAHTSKGVKTQIVRRTNKQTIKHIFSGILHENLKKNMSMLQWARSTCPKWDWHCTKWLHDAWYPVAMWVLNICHELTYQPGSFTGFFRSPINTSPTYVSVFTCCCYMCVANCRCMMMIDDVCTICFTSQLFMPRYFSKAMRAPTSAPCEPIEIML